MAIESQRIPTQPTDSEYRVPNPEGYDSARNLYGKFLRLSITGTENSPVDGRGIYAPNHSTLLDIPVTGVALDQINAGRQGEPRRATFIAKKELFDQPILGPWMEKHGTIPLDRDKSGKSTFDRAAKVLESDIDNMLVLYPQGTRVKGRPNWIEEGSALISSSAESPVYPMGIVYSFPKILRVVNVHIGQGVGPATRGKKGRFTFNSKLLIGMQDAYDIAEQAKRS